MIRTKSSSFFLALDLGTTATTARYSFVRDSFTSTGIPRRTLISRTEDVHDWPHIPPDYPMGNPCLPTDLVYLRETGELYEWGFGATRYLGNLQEGLAIEQVLVIEHIKLLLLGLDDITNTSALSSTQRAMCQTILQVLGKTQFEVFQDLLTCVFSHILESAQSRKGRILSETENIELSLAFPSGWPEKVHSRVAEIGHKAMSQAMERQNLDWLKFSMENVYTVSETLCGAKEWLKEVISDSIESEDPNAERNNIEDLNVSLDDIYQAPVR